MMRFYAFIAVIFIFTASFIISDRAHAQEKSTPPVKECRYCPAAYCEDPALAKQLKKEKKDRARRRGLPERLLKYFDQLPDCRACIETAPDWISLGYSIDRDAYQEQEGRDPGYDRRIMSWSRDVEKKLRDDMRKGLVKEIHFIHYIKTCDCCPDSKEAYEDWRSHSGTAANYNEEFEYDPQHGDAITDPGQLGKDPKDLTEMPENYRRPGTLDMPPIEEFMDPGIRVVQVICPACQGLADQYNALGRKVEALRRPIAQARRNIYLERQVVQDIWIEMEGLGKLANTPETAKERDKLDDELSTRQQQLERSYEKLQKLMKERAEMQAEMALLLEKIKACEESCKEPTESLQDGENKTAPAPEEDHAKTGTDAVKEEPEKEALAVSSPEKKKTGGKCATPNPKSIKIGPNGEYGTGAQVKNKAKNMAKSATLGALNNVIGGSGISLGGGGMGNVGSPGGGGSKGPKTEKDPTKGEFVRTAHNAVDLGVKAGFVKDGFAVSQKIFDSPGDNSTFHAMWVEDEASRVKAPKRYFIIGLYVDHKLTVWWTYDHWTNGVHDAHDEGSETRSWRTHEGNFIRRFEGAQGIENSIWYQSGFDTAVKGVKHIGAIFDVTAGELAGPCPLNLVTHVTVPGQEPDIGTIPFVNQLFIDPAESDGKSITNLNVHIKPVD